LAVENRFKTNQNAKQRSSVTKLIITSKEYLNISIKNYGYC